MDRTELVVILKYSQKAFYVRFKFFQNFRDLNEMNEMNEF